MAIIKCPECGGDVSDKAKSCPHCGVTIYVCPECGKASAGKMAACPHCGYGIQGEETLQSGQKQEQQNEAENMSAKPEIIDPAAAWKIACPREEKRKKGIWFAYSLVYLFGTISIILYLLAFYNIIYPLESEGTGTNVFSALQNLVDYNEFIKNLFIATTVIMCVFSVLRPLVAYCGINPTVKWMIKKKFNVIPFLQTEEIIITGTKADAYWATYCMLSPNGKAVFCLNGFAIGAGTGTGWILLVAALRELCLARLQHFYLGTKLEISSVTMVWVYLILALVVLLITITSMMICTQTAKKYLTNYLVDNVGNHAEK